jgi:Outer membrane protein beta-barrel domain
MNNERQFEHIEDKIRAAAENNIIVFEENSWTRMEALLNKKEPKRRFLWFWFLLPFACAFSYFGYSSFSKKEMADTKINNQIILKKDDGSNKNINKINDKPIVDENNINPTEEKNIYKEVKYSSVKKIEPIVNATNKFKSYREILTKKKITTSVDNNERLEIDDENFKTVKLKSKTKTKITAGNIEEDMLVEKGMVEPKNITHKEISFEKNNLLDSTKKIDKKATAQKSNSNKEKNLLARFYILGGLGADAGNTKLLGINRKEIEYKYGLSLGFNINNRLSVQTGFYKSNKKYVAGPNDYNAKEGTYLSTIKINTAEAACLVYEIPIDVRYSFLLKKQFNLFTKMGVSSFVMKSENYQISFVRNNNLYSRQYTYSGNDHLFSNANVSLGIEKNITKKIALQIEPSISIPLKGVGEGSVKLFSTAILMNIKYSPFKK